ncbi:MAG: DNA replication and repair protein RecF [Parachlamydiales bacterium]|nr:DNA replication and repair protein RecF [Parachlamydiales bacterium]
MRNFRSYSFFEIAFKDNLNIICGPNAIGKTNLLEAIYLLSTGSSFQTNHLDELIKFNENYFFIEAQIEKDNILQTLKLYYDGKTKKIIHNSTTYPSFTSLLGIMPSILHTPDDINLIKGKPLIRRKFLNLYLAQKDPLYVHHYLRFIKALKQKNYLLKNKNYSLIRPFEKEMVKSGAYLTLKRNELINNLKKPLIQNLQKLTKLKMNLDIRYLSSITISDKIEDIQTNFENELLKIKEKEQIFKTSLIGPHRDDFVLNANEKNAKIFASEGQKKLLLYSLMFAKVDLMKNSNAMLLIDDFETHLDKHHKNLIKIHFKNFNQIFLTLPTTQEPFENANIINLKKD